MKGGNSWSRTCLYYLKGLKRVLKGIKRTSPKLKTPLATHADLENAIVIYPETISGNPLRASKVVRWFLHQPGHHNTRTNYGENELYFYFQSVFNNPAFVKRNVSEFFINVMLESFKQTNFGQRNGTCFILRKGGKRLLQHDLSKGVVIDKLSHEEMAKVFNESEYCISYDLQTYYSFYAAVCGCKSIVVPDPEISKDVWRPREELRYGIAYGEEDLEWAIKTRPKMLDFLKREQQNTLTKVRKFGDDCFRFFS